MSLVVSCNFLERTYAMFKVEGPCHDPQVLLLYSSYFSFYLFFLTSYNNLMKKEKKMPTQKCLLMF